MSKPFSETDLSDQLTRDRTWRMKEISDLKVSIERSDQRSQNVLLRSLVAICYAHWEGYVRFSARKYFEHVALRKLKYDQLNRQFLKNYFLPRLAALSMSKTNVMDRCDLLDEILSSGEKRFARANDDLVNTKSNLNFSTFSEICLICGIDYSRFSEKETFIDVLMLKRRNSIAHGEETLVAKSDVDVIINETIGLMRNFSDELENIVYLGQYRAA